MQLSLMSIKAFSQAAENNKKPILKVLQEYIQDNDSILEIGSGTGQHALYFSNALPNIKWQTSDLPDRQADIIAGIGDSKCGNILSPLSLNVAQTQDWPDKKYNIIFTANTMHIMSWDEVKQMIQLVSKCLLGKGLFVCYGPFNLDGHFTSSSNEAFDCHLRSVAPDMGLRDIGDVCNVASKHYLSYKKRHDMPANNKTLVFEKITPD